MIGKKSLLMMLEQAEKNQATSLRGWGIASNELKKQNEKVSELTRENSKLKENIARYSHLTEFNRLNSVPAKHIVAYVNDEWVILKAGEVLGYGTNVGETDAYMEYGKLPTLNDARKIATLLNEADNQKDNDQ